jgi:hypothetical protein
MSEAVPNSEDLAMIDASARAAQASLAFYRLAFGLRGDGGTSFSLAQLATLARNYLGGGRLQIDLPQMEADLPRPVAKLALLALLSAAGMAPLGGWLVLDAVQLEPLSLRVSITGRRVALSDTARQLLEMMEPEQPPMPRDVHLMLLPRLAAALGARLEIAASPAMEDGAEATLSLGVMATSHAG